MNENPVYPPATRPVKVRRNKSALLYLRVLDTRIGLRQGSGCMCAVKLGEVIFGPPVKMGSRLGEPAWVDFRRIERDRRYGMPKRYGMRTTVTTRRVDRVDPVRRLY